MTSRAVVLLLVLAALVTTLAFPLREYIQQQSQIRALEQQVSITGERVTSLRHQRAQWQDPAFIEAQARDRLHFVFPGEIGYVVLSPQDVREARKPVIAKQQPVRQAWYDTFWSSVQAADAAH
ncbi:MAG: septum formation initiator family protein [Actinomycetes bacterium]